MSLTGLQIISMIVFGIFGFQRGWRREIISLGGILLSVLFLAISGGKILAFFFFVGIPLLFQTIGSRIQGIQGGQQSPPDPPTTDVMITTLLAFLLIIVLGYVMSNRMFPKPGKPVDNVLGVLPAVVSGFILSTFVLSNIPPFNLPIFTASWINVGFNAPSLGSNPIALIFIAILVVLVISLLAASTKKKSAPPASPPKPKA